ncbi:hypothetical protein VSVS12_03245 [Vibrio scophthalmi]|uniref:hypothetical protein n=1 Tax=Vibrio scophthalmi TaxID=45658 RepID=UPI00080934C7|nr:hypothetical protein [Vibrio scophthalmi]ANS86954.1 hypothetical protein VSVS12_03245 [Vibrio scophthalmi]
MTAMIHTTDAVYREIEKAETIKSTIDTANQDLTYEDGVISALMWAMGKTSSPCEDIE